MHRLFHNPNLLASCHWPGWLPLCQDCGFWCVTHSLIYTSGHLRRWRCDRSVATRAPPSWRWKQTSYFRWREHTIHAFCSNYAKVMCRRGVQQSPFDCWREWEGQISPVHVPQPSQATWEAWELGQSVWPSGPRDEQNMATKQWCQIRLYLLGTFHYRWGIVFASLSCCCKM